MIFWSCGLYGFFKKMVIINIPFVFLLYCNFLSSFFLFNVVKNIQSFIFKFYSNFLNVLFLGFEILFRLTRLGFHLFGGGYKAKLSNKVLFLFLGFSHFYLYSLNSSCFIKIHKYYTGRRRIPLYFFSWTFLTNYSYSKISILYFLKSPNAYKKKGFFCGNNFIIKDWRKRLSR